jgi:hypothetical protein
VNTVDISSVFYPEADKEKEKYVSVNLFCPNQQKGRKYLRCNKRMYKDWNKGI